MKQSIYRRRAPPTSDAAGLQRGDPRNGSPSHRMLAAMPAPQARALGAMARMPQPQPEPLSDSVFADGSAGFDGGFGGDFSSVPSRTATAQAPRSALAIAAPDAPQEREAERIAERALRMPAMPEHACACGGVCPKCRAQEAVRGDASLLRYSNGARSPSHAPPIVHDVLASAGRALDPAARAFFEPRFGRDFGDVRVHTDDRAGASAQAVGARAYTVGRDVVFAPGAYAPGSAPGRGLIAHELAHVVQQTSGSEQQVARVPTEAGAREGRYSYSANCGWIDWSHAAPALPLELVRRVQAASDSLRTAGSAASPQTGELTSPDMTSSVRGIVLSSANVRVRLLRPLSADEVLAVALSIFKTQSIAFETQQMWTDIVGQSSFSQEDLPSNLIAFYMAVRGYTREDIMRFCGGVNTEASAAEYRRSHEFRDNRSFAPIGASGAWPAELSTIDDRAAASLYETLRIGTQQGTETYSYCPMYRIVGTVGETSLFILSFGGTTFAESDDVRVVPTYRMRPATSGRYGHTHEIEVQPARASDEAALRGAGLSWPLSLPAPVLRCLTSRGNPG